MVVAGTPSQVTEQLEDLIKSMRIGHLMVLNQIGSMPHDLAMENIRLTATKVLPNLRHIWRGQVGRQVVATTATEPAPAG